MGQERRLKLHAELCNLLGSNEVYYQPPESVKMKYDAIVYYLSDIDQNYANDRTYSNMSMYSIIVISKSPESDLVERLLHSFPYCSFDRSYKSDNLNHYVMKLYY